MNGTPRLRSAFPATPARTPGQRTNGAAGVDRLAERIPTIPTIQPTLPTSPNEPLIPEHIIDAPSQRLYAFTIWVALWAWKVYDFSTLNEVEEQSLWLFMRWIAIDGVWLFGLPSMRIPWLEWSSTTMTLLFMAHALVDGMMMFRIPLPVFAVFGWIGRSIWGAYEMAVNERRVNPRALEFNESLILGRQIIHILPEGSAILNLEKESFCIGDLTTEIKLPITINATSPISMELLRVDLDTHANETLHISKSQIKTLHKEASRLLSYSDKPNEPKTLFYTVKKPGLYVLQKVMDESNLEVARKRMAHTVVVPCPRANILPTYPHRCRGELSNVELEVTGTPPLRVKYRKMVGTQPQEAILESVQPEDFASPLAKVDQTALTRPNRIEIAWAQSQTIRVPLSESLATTGTWVYSISEVTDAFGNVVSYGDRQHEYQDKHAKSVLIHQHITVHERPTVLLHGCSPGKPLKVAKGRAATLPIRFGSSGRGEIPDASYNLELTYSPQSDVSATGEHSGNAQQKRVTVKSSKLLPQIQEAGLYTITGVSTDFCQGEVLEPASCLLQNPPEPRLTIRSEEIFDKCAGSPIGLRVDLDLIGTPPFEIRYHMYRKGERVHKPYFEKVDGLRGQIELTPRTAGDYEYEFLEISDAVYKGRPLQNLKLTQSVKPAASAQFLDAREKKTTCIDETVAFDVGFTGEGPFSIEYELVHGGKRAKYNVKNVTDTRIEVRTDPLRDGGDYTLALVSVTDALGCKEFLKDEAKISVRHQKPKIGFGQIEGKRRFKALEGQKVLLPLRIAGEAPWTVRYLDRAGVEHTMRARDANEGITVDQEGTYTLTSVSDAVCPGQVDEPASTFEVGWIQRPQIKISETDIVERKGNVLVKNDVCEGEEDSIEVLLKGSGPYLVQYTQNVKLVTGTAAPKNRDLRAAVNVASLRMATAQAGVYDYKLTSLSDSNYDHSAKHFSPLTIQQRVNPRPSVAFKDPGKTYSFCSVEAEGEQTIPLTLSGSPPFNVEVEIKHHGTARPETLTLPHIDSHAYILRIPHSKLHLGKSAISLRRVSDSKNCYRILDSSIPRVQISVHDPPTISPLESTQNFCVGDRLNYALAGQAPFTIHYSFEGSSRKAVAASTTFRRLAEKPGTFAITGITDSASACRAGTNLTAAIHPMPSVRVSQGREAYVDIHEGGEAEILFEFGGTPPFEFTYTRSTNTDRGGKRGTVVDMKHERSMEKSLRIRASEEGTYEVVAIRDAWCAYAKPGVNLDGKGAQRRLGL